MSEHDHQVALFSCLASYPHTLTSWCFAIPNGGHRDVRVAKKMKAEGVKAGVWDIFLPVARLGYHGLFIEMKFGKNKLTQTQERFRSFVDQQGYKTVVAYDWQEAYDEIMEYIEE